MSAMSSMRRQLTESRDALKTRSTRERFGLPRVRLGTTGKPKGPARRPREVDLILGAKRAARAAAELQVARATRSRRLRIVGAIALAAGALALGLGLFLH